ncbi:30S ribosomal protein S16 [Candidatus Nomurabacteria bacterium RIFCSPLOWO2_01_FULL_36_10b]|uniref:Small ribosomal subunit protein bS16 n=1 Tax=Candidatus Nomurabacteria bacterium RIFCSPLOWO2_01_FULL_36_10b TaxID=1801766 RepID=A0A1F6WQB2_9BACT|nr:MAG: 30S ribosomal protein S16 [Candidatus Nomurabacteria bacterium RIFCSPLOWO2_01_FULL_36_10b]
MLKIRLQRIGRRHDPKFRVIVTEASRGPKTGKFIEVVGSYDAKAGNTSLVSDRIKYWLSMGAQTSDTVHNILISQKVIEGKKVNALPKKTVIKKDKKEEIISPLIQETEVAVEEAPVEQN